MNLFRAMKKKIQVPRGRHGKISGRSFLLLQPIEGGKDRGRKEKEGIFAWSVTGLSSFKKKKLLFFLQGKKMSGVFMSTTYSPRYEFVTTKFLTQIRIYRVYTEDRQIFVAQTFFQFSYFPCALRLGCGLRALV